MCRQKVSPYSTFKIISALLGLQKGVIVDESSTMGYDGMWIMEMQNGMRI